MFSKLSSFWSQLPNKIKGAILLAIGGGASAAHPVLAHLDHFTFASFKQAGVSFLGGALVTFLAWLSQSPANNNQSNQQPPAE